MYFSAAPYRRSVAAFAAAVLVLCLLQGKGGFAAERGDPPASEYHVKAAFVYNFFKFVTWPSSDASEGGALRLCILGDLPDAAPFDDLEGQEILGKRLHVVHLRQATDARACQVLFLPASQSRRLPETLELLRGSPVLTVGDTDGFAQRGVMINMYLDKKRVRFEINTATAAEAGLRISTKLLNLAGTVYGTVRTGK
jgi:hypothetical protein